MFLLQYLDLNPHSHTPVEILHVILLGVVKYFWHDAINRLSKEQLELLKIRINSLDLTGLDPSIGTLNGNTFVQYAGSLVGRDFRVIAQIAVFILYDLLPSKILRAWAALATLMPLVWMPKISNKTDYFVSLFSLLISSYQSLSRKNWRLLLTTFCKLQWNGLLAGSTRTSFTFSSISLSTYDFLDLQYYLPQKPMSPSMQSYVPGVSTLTALHHPEIQPTVQLVLLVCAT